VRIGLLMDGALAEGVGPEQRFADMIDEVLLAEELGFDFFGLAEVHFSSVLTLSAPEVVFGMLASRTSRIRLRTASFVLLSFNHPIRVAERIATLDAATRGRMELGTARSNQAHTLEAFGISPDETREQFWDSLEVILKALSQETFEHDGPVWKIPERSLFPKPVQKPHPPVSVAATSPDTHRLAGEHGIGVMSGNSLPGGWDFVQDCHDLYRRSWTDPAEQGRAPNSSFGALALKAYCAETKAEAFADASSAAFEVVDLVMNWYTALAKQSPDYRYMADFEALTDRQRDLDFMVERAPYLSIGDPDFFVERIKRLASMGVDEFILTIDGFTHEQQMRTIGLLGREVIPRVRSLDNAASAEAASAR
jgi:alkanesulfonate monooxygenase SsuD/methylene tetrahydromethanopterin reductase-like flavin-dependent oxidoreductase (luciferase family)